MRKRKRRSIDLPLAIFNRMTMWPIDALIGSRMALDAWSEEILVTRLIENIDVLRREWTHGEIPWSKVVFADELPDCPDCGEKWCERHRQHYADCPCLGPTQDDVEYKVVRGVLYARKRIE